MLHWFVVDGLDCLLNTKTQVLTVGPFRVVVRHSIMRWIEGEIGGTFRHCFSARLHDTCAVLVFAPDAGVGWQQEVGPRAAKVQYDATHDFMLDEFRTRPNVKLLGLRFKSRFQ